MRKMISEKECLEMGGHCYEEEDFVVLTYPPIVHRICKHCGHQQEGRQQPTIKWVDDPISTPLGEKQGGEDEQDV